MAAVAVVGASAALVLLMYLLSLGSTRIVRETKQNLSGLSWITLISCIIGLVSGLALTNATPEQTILTLTVLGLIGIQVPVDVYLRLLWRPATIAAAIVVLGVYVFRSILHGSIMKSAGDFVVATIVVLLFSFTHLIFPNSLGRGDALLVIPLSYAVAYGDSSKVVVWVFLACATGALNGMFITQRYKESVLPFGPHLLYSAWILQISSI